MTYQDAFDHIPTPVIVRSTDTGVLHYANDASRTTLPGHRLPDLIGESVYPLVDSAVSDEWRRASQAALRDGSREKLVEVTGRWYRRVISPIDRRRGLVRVALVDITPSLQLAATRLLSATRRGLSIRQADPSVVNLLAQDRTIADICAVTGWSVGHVLAELARIAGLPMT